MKTSFRILSLTVVTALAVGASGAAPNKAWSPDRALLSQLGPEQIAGPYQLRPPEGYELQTRPGPDGTLQHAWISPVRQDNTRCILMLITLTPPASEKKKYTLNEVQAKMLAGVRRRRTNWKQSPTEPGTINGITFLRTYWRGTEPTTGQAMHGFSYVARDGRSFLQLSSQDLESYWKDTLPVTEASVLTLKKL